MFYFGLELWYVLECNWQMKRQVNRRRARFSHKSHKISFSSNSVVTHRYKNQQPKTLDREHLDWTAENIKFLLITTKSDSAGDMNLELKF